MKTSEQTDKLWPAIVKARQSMKGPKKDAENPGFKRDGKALKYADLSACIEAADDAGAAHGLVTLQEVTSDSAGASVSTLVVHESGQWVQSDPVFIPANKQDAQGFGSAISYGRRYSLKAFWNMADEDDDGNAAVAGMKQQQRPPAPPNGYDDWLTTVQDVAKRPGITLDAFRAVYAQSKPEHRKYLETHNSGLLKAMTAKLPKAT